MKVTVPLQFAPSPGRRIRPPLVAALLRAPPPRAKPLKPKAAPVAAPPLEKPHARVQAMRGEIIQTRTIPSNHWVEYFDCFSRDPLGCSINIEVLDRKTGPQHIASDMPLQGISFDTKGTRASSIEISAGDRADSHVSHVVDMPLHIREADEGNRNVDVQIEPAVGPITLIHVRGLAH